MLTQLLSKSFDVIATLFGKFHEHDPAIIQYIPNNWFQGFWNVSLSDSLSDLSPVCVSILTSRNFLSHSTNI